MNSHSVFGWFVLDVAIFPPKEAKKIAMFRVDVHLMKHSLNIACEGHWFLSESTEHTDKIVGELWSLEEVTVEALAGILYAAVKHHPYLFGLLGVVNPVVRNIPDSAIVESDLLRWYSFSVAPVNDFCHEQEVVPSITAIILESSLELVQTI